MGKEWHRIFTKRLSLIDSEVSQHRSKQLFKCFGSCLLC